MSEHIKTGADIHNDLDMTYETTNECERDRLSAITWVSLSWLKEQIDKQTNDVADKPVSVYDTGAWDMLRWFSKLLEEKK